MTPQEKQKATRQRHKELQQTRQAAAKAEQELIRQNLHTILESADATPAEKLKTIQLLLELSKGKGYSSPR